MITTTSELWKWMGSNLDPQLDTEPPTATLGYYNANNTK